MDALTSVLRRPTPPDRLIPFHDRLRVPVRRVAALGEDAGDLRRAAVVGHQRELHVVVELLQQVPQEPEPDPEIGLALVQLPCTVTSGS